MRFRCKMPTNTRPANANEPTTEPAIMAGEEEELEEAAEAPAGGAVGDGGDVGDGGGEGTVDVGGDGGTGGAGVSGGDGGGAEELSELSTTPNEEKCGTRNLQAHRAVADCPVADSKTPWQAPA